ncbi:rho family GTPase [Naegleria gruberi]|uniref:Rho family GTPase n=1 Tax=Naegleria gruberi TaxID=5762 RepID=D2VQS3_NAEGR|nr:rho family GTPase [Naegleria gruberi]EFC40756.1 rho family GTPase [Naegleria gruberi]|eukprot:XP_002673500.1 rho family GTPase [Naegleria gruberi strain NEG-M]
MQSLNEDEFGVIFSFLDCIFVHETFSLVSRSFNSLLIRDEYQKEYVRKKIQRLTSEDTKKHDPTNSAPKSYNRYRMDKLYDPYLHLENNFRKTFLELKEKVEKEIEESVEERRKVAKIRSSKEELYQHFEEIKSTIQEKHLEPLKGVDLTKESCTEGQKSNHKKIIFNGDGSVGKTWLIHYLDFGDAPTYYNLPFDTSTISYHYNNIEISKFYLWDTAGQEELRPLSYPETDLFCACFSTVSTNSFENIQHKWIPEIRHYNPDIPIILIGCKVDLRKSLKVLQELKFQHFTTPISFSEGELMARSTGCCTYVESSAITGEGNTKELAEIFAKTLIYYNQRELFPKKKKKNCQLM